MRLFKIAPGYVDDLQAAYDYFKQGGTPTASRFLDRYAAALAMLRDRPLLFRIRSDGWRHCPIPRSSYTIFYRELPDLWLLGGVLSTVQDPDTLQAKLLIREIRDGELM